MSTKIVAFMQNMWVRDPERVKASIAKYGEDHRRRMIAHFLFAGCLTGRRLRAELGELCDEIVWEEASRDITATASANVAPDAIHIANVLKIETPHIVVAFGKIAYAGVYGCVIPVVRSPHPAARRQQDQIDFKSAMRTLIEMHSQTA